MDIVPSEMWAARLVSCYDLMFVFIRCYSSITVDKSIRRCSPILLGILSIKQTTKVNCQKYKPVGD